MIRTAKLLFCSEDHGSGDQTFPCIADLDTDSFIRPASTRELRSQARTAGWRCIKGRDFCESCVEAMKERGELSR
jgi:hypothetical protein